MASWVGSQVVGIGSPGKPGLGVSAESKTTMMNMVLVVSIMTPLLTTSNCLLWSTTDLSQAVHLLPGKVQALEN